MTTAAQARDTTFLSIVAKGSVAFLFSQLIVTLSTLLTRSLVAHALSVTDFGLFSLGSAITLVLAQIPTVSLSAAITRTVSLWKQTDIDRGRSLSDMTWLAVAGGFLLGTALFVLVVVMRNSIAAFFHQPSLVHTLPLFGLLFSLTITTGMLCAIPNGLGDFRTRIALNDLGPALARMVLVGLLFCIGLSLTAAIMAHIAAAALAAGVAVFLIVRKHAYGSWRTPHYRLLIAQLLPIALSLALVQLTELAMSRANTFIIGHFAGANAVAFFEIAVTLGASLTLPANAIATAFLPCAGGEYRSSGVPGLGQLYSFATKWTVQLTLPLFGLLWLIPGVIVRMIFGTKYLAAVPALRIMALGYLVLCLMGPASHALIVLGKPKMILYGTAGGALAAVFIGLVTVPIYGAVGGAGAVAAGQVATAIILVTIACTAVKLNLLERSCLQMVIMILYPLIIIGATAAGFEGLMGHYLPPLLIVLVTSIVLVSAALLMSITTLSGTDRLVLDDIKRSLRPSLSQNSEDET